ncbi:hypothetical protein GCM10010384_35140 [Streptomyces djakartensis]|uniref:Uncharacterized protein n=1 Tax=Streptomyces djakartensis TaxID=68193 RepID=A0ABQ2ZWQ1_9ACTN|nr:hypothetical protein GCM10010384_35140 [Streptomyces djakartensis]
MDAPGALTRPCRSDYLVVRDTGVVSAWQNDSFAQARPHLPTLGAPPTQVDGTGQAGAHG